jgi:hypothetical protein
MQPLAEALGKALYRDPSNLGVWVKDQHGALLTVQSWLRDGRRLASVDLSSATDLLDFRVFTRALKRDFPGSTGLLAEYAEYFEDLASLPLWSEELGVAVQFATGQPLGMKGSFQILTWMNYLAAASASLGYARSRDLGIAKVVDHLFDPHAGPKG